MRTTLTVLTLLAAWLFAAAPAAADTGLYANAGYTHYEVGDVTLGGVSARLGYRFHPNFAVEGEAAFGVEDDNVGPVAIELDNQVAAYGVVLLPLSPGLDLFARAGWARLEAEASVPGASIDADEDGFAFGGGAQVMLTSRFGLRGEYTRIDGEDFEADTVSASAVLKF